VIALLRLAGFAAVLAAVLGVGYAAGSTLGSAPAAPQSDTRDGAHGGHDAVARTPQPDGIEVAGLSVAERSYAMRLHTTRVQTGTDVPISFTIAGPLGSPVTSYRVEHDKELHLIAVRRDFTGFQHVHPARDASGVWSTRLDLRPGSWRVFADFVPGGGDATQGLTLGSDLEVAGAYAPAAPAKPATSARVDDLTVTLTGRPRAGQTSELAFAVTRGGRNVEPEPYLGARGHLVVLREGDLAYLHVHPDEDALSFATEVPTPGRYRLFLDVKVDGRVRTAAFTVEVGA
jgi:hypothetical protein